jgi:CCR4-NOT transcription complex subunit 3
MPSAGQNIAQIKIGGNGQQQFGGGAGLFSGPNPFQSLNSQF